EHVVVGRRDVHVAAHDHVLGTVGDDVAQRREPGQLVVVVVGVGLAAVRDVDRVDPDPTTGGGDGSRLWLREPGPVLDTHRHVVEPDPRQDRDAVPSA